MHWHGTSISGMGESVLLWLHHLLLCTSVAVPQKKFDIIEKAELSAGKHRRKEARRRDNGRIHQAEHRAQEQHKKYRLARQQAKQREEELRVTREGVTYEAAGFDRTQLCRAGRKKKQKRT